MTSSLRQGFEVSADEYDPFPAGKHFGQVVVAPPEVFPGGVVFFCHGIQGVAGGGEICHKAMGRFAGSTFLYA